MAPPAGEICTLNQTGRVGFNNANSKDKTLWNTGQEFEEKFQEDIQHPVKDFDRQLVQDLLSQHGDPSNINDQFKTLGQIKLDSERDICIFAGAIDLLNNQLGESKKSDSCAVCARSYETQECYDNCLAQIKVKIDETETARTESNVLKVHEACTLALLKQFQENNETCQSRVAFNMRTGALTELRNQKAECLQDLKCFACLRNFRGSDVTDYLTMVDRQAYQMQERLHVHN
mmetsp:Transcript_13238/g.21543  ORF Transcript_13238/g.21543 Transcript_13238/m.21543 type:complete len:232 (+) Transcript_13238:148-843(+)